MGNYKEGNLHFLLDKKKTTNNVIYALTCLSDGDESFFREYERNGIIPDKEVILKSLQKTMQDSREKYKIKLFEDFNFSNVSYDVQAVFKFTNGKTNHISIFSAFVVLELMKRENKSVLTESDFSRYIGYLYDAENASIFGEEHVLKSYLSKIKLSYKKIANDINKSDSIVGFIVDAHICIKQYSNEFENIVEWLKPYITDRHKNLLGELYDEDCTINREYLINPNIIK